MENGVKINNMSENDNIMEQNIAPREVEIVETPPLLKAVGEEQPEYWQCIRYKASTQEKKNWRVSEAVGCFCLVCKTELVSTLPKIRKRLSDTWKKAPTNVIWI